MVKINKSIFFPPKNRRLARIISIKTPGQFRKSIAELKKRGLTLKEKRGLVLAQNRARVQLKRRNLSKRERNQMREIANTKIPNVSRK